MVKLILLCFFSLAFLNLRSQNKKDEMIDSCNCGKLFNYFYPRNGLPIYSSEYIATNNIDSLLKIIKKIIIYPPEIKEKDTTVYVRFLINKNGNVTCEQISISAGFYFDREALRVVRLLRFNPIDVENKILYQAFTMRIHFYKKDKRN